MPEYRYSVEELQNDPGCECSVCLQVCSEVHTSPLNLLAPTAHSFMSRVVDLGTVPLHHWLRGSEASLPLTLAN